MGDYDRRALRLADAAVPAADRRALRWALMGDGPPLDPDRLEEERRAFREELRLDGFTDDEPEDLSMMTSAPTFGDEDTDDTEAGDEPEKDDP